jgi:hypothetical protein
MEKVVGDFTVRRSRVFVHSDGSVTVRPLGPGGDWVAGTGQWFAYGDESLSGLLEANYEDFWDEVDRARGAE